MRWFTKMSSKQSLATTSFKKTSAKRLSQFQQNNFSVKKKPDFSLFSKLLRP
jgi:hypothetical protein